MTSNLAPVPSDELESAVGWALGQAGVSGWCVSRALRQQGMDAAIALYATDLARTVDRHGGSDHVPSEDEARRGILARAQAVDDLPFMEHLVFVPHIGRMERGPRGDGDASENAVATAVDPTWEVALLLSLGLAPNADWEEQVFRAHGTEFLHRVQRWTALFGAPDDNDDWRDVIRGGEFPFLLVPSALRGGNGVDRAAERERLLDRLRRVAAVGT